MDDLNKSSIYNKQFSLNQSRHSSEKLQRLEKRLSGLGFSIDLQRNEKIEKLSERVHSLDMKLMDIKGNSEKSYQRLTEKLNDIHTDLENYRNELEEFKKHHKEKLEKLEKKTNTLMEKQKEEWHNLKDKLIKDFQNKATSLKTEIIEGYEIFEEKQEMLKKYYDCELKKLVSLIQNEINERVKTEKKNLGELDDKINDLVKIVKGEQLNRKSCVDNLVSLIEQFYGSVKKEIDKERIQRVNTEATLVGLFERTLDQFGMSLT